jgi:hypothetical protein
MKRRLTDEEMLMMARPGAPVPDLSVGDDVHVLFQFSDPVEATVVGGIDRSAGPLGWHFKLLPHVRRFVA